MPSWNTLKLESPEAGIAILTLNRPKALNAITYEMIEEFHAALTHLESDHAMRVVILTGAGRGFCAGTDLKAGRDSGGAGGPESPAPSSPASARRGVDVSRIYRGQRRLADLVLHMRKIPQPIIAAVNGAAAGGGFSFSMAADIRVAAESAKFIVSFINVGVSAGDVGSSYFLPRLIGLSRASELMYTGRPMDAAEAERCGYVSRVVPDGQALPAALEIARVLLTKGPFGLRMTKEILNHALEAPSLEAQLYMENRTQSLAVTGGDFQIAIDAFREGRPPVYPPEQG